MTSLLYATKMDNMSNKLRIIGNRIYEDLKKNRSPIVIILLFWLFMTLVFHRFCPVVLFCGFPCPGCGMTRAFFYFFTLRPMRAFGYNPVFPLWIVTIALMAWRRYVKGKSLSALYALLIFTALVTIAVYVYRIMYVFPGQEPMVFVHGNLLSKLSPIYDKLITEKLLK